MTLSTTSLHFIDYPVFSISNTVHRRMLALALRNYACKQQYDDSLSGVIVLSCFEKVTPDFQARCRFWWFSTHGR